MSIADVISSIEIGMFREVQARENGNSNVEPIDCSSLGDKPVIKANNKTDRRTLEECFKE